MTEPDRVDQDAARGKEPEHGAGETDDARGLGGMSFLDHLDELRRRLFISVLSLVGGFSVCYPFSDVIFAFLSRPIHHYFPDGTQLAYTKLTEPFIVLLKVSAIAGVFLASPVI